MALVKGPFFSTWASGSFGKVLTVRWLGGNARFVMASYKSRSGKRHQIQINNARILGERMRYFAKLEES